MFSPAKTYFWKNLSHHLYTDEKENYLDHTGMDHQNFVFQLPLRASIFHTLEIVVEICVFTGEGFNK